MIMQRLFSLLLDAGVVLVATSNRPPERLYENGLNRELFLPFIDLLNKRCIILNVDQLDSDSSSSEKQLSGSDLPTPRADIAPATTATQQRRPPAITHDKDYRLQMTHLPNVAITAPAQSVRSAQHARSIAAASAGVAFEAFTPCNVPVGFGRTMHVAHQYRPNGGSNGDNAASQGTAVVTFADLCGKAVGAGDYYALADAFHTLVIVDIPRLTLSEADQARRFITLVDVLYEAKVRTFFVCDVPISTVLDGIKLNTTVNSSADIKDQLGGVQSGGGVTTSGGGVASAGKGGANQYSDSQTVTVSLQDAPGGDEGDAFEFKRSLHPSAGQLHFSQALPAGGGHDGGAQSRFATRDAGLGAPGSAAGMRTPVSTRVTVHGGASSSWGTTMVGDVEWSATGRIGVSLAELSGVTDVAFAMHRALSRLAEMQSEEYFRRAETHRAQPPGCTPMHGHEVRCVLCAAEQRDACIE